MTRAGSLNSKVILQSPADGFDEIGQPVTTWVDVVIDGTLDNKIPADVRYQSGLSAIKAGADVSTAKASIRLRHRAVNAGQRIKQGDTVFAIQAVLPDARRVYVDLVAEVVT